MTLTSPRLLLRVLPALLVAVVGVLALLPATPASAAPSTAKSCTLTGTNVYTCTLTITPTVTAAAGDPWLVKVVTPGPGTITSPTPVVSSSTTGCTNLPSVTTPGGLITAGNFADYNVVIGSGGCAANAVVVVTETVAVTASGQVCQTVWINPMSPGVTSCATVEFSAQPTAQKTCTLTSTVNRYTCLFTVTPAFPAEAGDLIHVNEAPGPLMTGPATILATPTVGTVTGCNEVPSPVTMSSSTGYHAQIGASGCPGTSWSVQFVETVTVTASGPICQSFWMVAAVPPVTACASVVYVPQAAATKTCVTTATPNVYTCTFTITPAVAANAGDAWLVQVATPGPGTLTTPSPVVSSSTTGCTNLPTVTTPGGLITTGNFADYNVLIGSGGCTASAAVSVTETVTVTASGQLCQTVWINTGSPGLTACAAVELAKSLTGPEPGKFEGVIAPSGVSLVVFGGGSTTTLGAAVTAAGGTSVWITVNGAFVGYKPGSPAFVNATFNATFPGGQVPSGTIVLVVR